MPAHIFMTRNIKDAQKVSVETRNAFQSGSGSGGHLQLPVRAAIAREPFTMYVELSVESMGNYDVPS